MQVQSPQTGPSKPPATLRRSSTGNILQQYKHDSSGTVNPASKQFASHPISSSLSTNSRTRTATIPRASSKKTSMSTGSTPQQAKSAISGQGLNRPVPAAEATKKTEGCPAPDGYGTDEDRKQQVEEGYGPEAGKAMAAEKVSQRTGTAVQEPEVHQGDHAGLPANAKHNHGENWKASIETSMDYADIHDLHDQQSKDGSRLEIPSYAHEALGAPYEPPLSPDSPEWRLHMPAAKPADIDQGTPDEWIHRSTALLRRTGKHPLNAEPSMSDLITSGFLTPTGLHYVRNHALVPHIQWSEHRININGLVERPLSITMDELVSMPSVTLPVTLVCSGNRRQEINETRQSNAYGWGPCTTSTQMWTGVRLRDLLIKAGAKVGEQGPGHHVAFRGPTTEVRKGSGEYATSLPWHHAMDPAADVILAYKQNGRWLAPDHGFPVRMVIPGWIAGRMVKWLSEITVQADDTRSYYHMYDNRMLPSNVKDHETGVKDGYWENDDYLVTELNINSAICSPGHDEVFMLGGKSKAVKLKGYAYAGRGSRVTRVEVSTDGGINWNLAVIQRYERPNAYGRFWCWALWEYEVPSAHLLRAEDLQVRAWDQAMNTQPNVFSWNLLGLMNNSCYRVKIHTYTDDSGALGIRFQHPAPGQKGKLGNPGWMEEEASKRRQPEDDELAAAGGKEDKKDEKKGGGGRKITMAEVEQHRTRERGTWFVREGKVYDPTPFLDQHPGGADAIISASGGDATEEFNAIHPPAVWKQLEQYYIGDLVEEGEDGGDQAGRKADGEKQEEVQKKQTEPGPLVTLNPRQKIKLKLAERIEVTHNTRIFRFALPSPDHILGLPTGSHVMVYAKIDDKLVIRPYTPISSDEDKGHLDFLIKVYYAHTNPKFPEGGKMSQYMDKLKVGDEMEFKGPVGNWTYDGRGKCHHTDGDKQSTCTHMSMVAGGTGITPIWQVITKVLRDPEDKTQMSLLFANVSPDDVLLRDELDDLAKQHPDRFKVWYVVDAVKEGQDWPFSTGRVNEELMKDKLFPASPFTIALMCGPPGLIEHAGKPGFKAMGYSEDNYVLF